MSIVEIKKIREGNASKALAEMGSSVLKQERWSANCSKTLTKNCNNMSIAEIKNYSIMQCTKGK